ncbi:MAG: hypothetical protein QG577_876 [Thermodesulfobacteriota bacterium]|nr:hypothetical protein [Thermodesulfobacteriota bacterium]
MKDSQRDLGRQIRMFRKEKGISLTTLSRLTGIAASNLSSIELNKTSPTLSTLVKIADAFNMKVGELLNDVLYGRAVFCPSIKCVKESDGGPGLFMNSLTSYVQKAALQAREIKIEGASEAFGIPDEAMDRFLYCVSGTLKIMVEGRTHNLMTGDGLYLRAWVRGECLPVCDHACVVLVATHMRP